MPKNFLKNNYRKEMRYNAKKVIKKLEKILNISEIYLLGSFVTKKRRPADVDIIILLKTKHLSQKSKWAVDFVVTPSNKFGEETLKDAEKWMKQKYGYKNMAFIKLK